MNVVLVLRHEKVHGENFTVHRWIQDRGAGREKIHRNRELHTGHSVQKSEVRI